MLLLFFTTNISVTQASEILDQSQISYLQPFDGLHLHYSSPTWGWQFQGFTPSVSGRVSKITLKMKQTGSVGSGNVWINIVPRDSYYDNSPPVPPAWFTVLATSSMVSASSVSTASNGGDVDFVFSSGQSLVAGQLYFIMVQGDFGYSTSNYLTTAWQYPNAISELLWMGDPTSPGLSGSFNDRDFYFKEYVEGQAYHSTVHWAGVGQQAAKVGGSWSVPILYDFCDDYANLNDLIATFYDDAFSTGDASKVLFDKSLIGPPRSCSGQLNLTGPVIESSAFNSSSAFIELHSSSEGFIASSSLFDVVVTSDVVSASSTNFVEIFTPNNDQRYSSASSSVLFQLNYGNENFDVVKLKIHSVELNSNFNFVYNIEKGTSSVLFPVISGLVAGNYYATANLAFFSSSSTLASDVVHFIIGADTPSRPNNDVVALIPASPTSYCSIDETQNGDTWVKLKCSIFNSFITFFNWTGDFLKIYLSDVKLALGFLFPFNIPIQFYNSWQEASDSASMSNVLQPLDNILVDNNLIITIPAGLSGTGQDRQVPVFGPAVFGFTPALVAFFAFVRVLSTYFTWGLFLFYIYGLANDVYYQSWNAVK